MPQLVALGVQPFQGDALGSMQQGMEAKQRLDAGKLQQAQAAMQMIGSGAMYAMNGDINGEVDPAKYAEVLDGFAKMGVPNVDQFRDNPNFAKIAAQASISAMDKIRMAKDERDFEFAMKKFEADLMAGPKRSLQPVYGTDKNGNNVLLQVGNDGTAVQTQVPEGVNISTGVDKVDLGTQFGLLDKRSGQIIGYMPKDVAGEAAQKEIGKQSGEAQMQLGGAITKADQSIALIDQMLQHPGLSTAVGLSGTLDPRNYIAGTDATDFSVMAKQLQGKAFLEAFESLKGGGQITEVEGTRATEAIARLSTAQSEEAYKEALNELKGILEQGKQRSIARAGQAAPASSAPPAPRGAPNLGEVTSQEQYDALPSGAEFISGGKRYRKP